MINYNTIIGDLEVLGVKVVAASKCETGKILSLSGSLRIYCYKNIEAITVITDRDYMSSRHLSFVDLDNAVTHINKINNCIT